MGQLDRDRATVIEETLIYHHKTKVDGVLQCLCGYVFPLGASIYRHTAEILDAVLAYDEAEV